MALESVTANATEALPDANDSLFRFVVQGLLLTLIGLFGLAGNIISIVILYRLNMRSSINCCLLGLTTFDLLVIITSVLSFGLLEIGLYTKSISWYVNGLLEAMPTVFPLGIIARTGSIYLTLILTVERYVAVCLPFRFRSLVTYGRARILVMAAAVFSVLYNLPRFWEHYYENLAVVLQKDRAEEMSRMCRLRSTLIIASFIMTLSSGGTASAAAAAAPSSAHRPGGLFERYARGGPSDGCGPNPLSKLAQLINAITGDDLTAEDVSWHLQKDPYMMRDMLALLQFRQYHNCMTTGEGARF
ncbi:FMRFamide receptor-like [Palaemon carinicauda]|uniref:FMRFamide receptor-like n=1 Tax=Palaemon carinicauda TaxID=392227 RepID=UPI0035B6919E